MDSLTNKKYLQFDYFSRYLNVPYYYNKQKEDEVCGIGTQMNKNSEYVNHQVHPGDTLDSLALKYYNNPTYWWVIAYFNTILDPFIVLSNNYKVLRIPSLSSISFKNERT